MIDYVTLPSPGDGPFIHRDKLVPGDSLMGLAPIGIRWTATVSPRGKIKPAGNCPAGEFAITHVLRDHIWHEVVTAPSPKLS